MIRNKRTIAVAVGVVVYTLYYRLSSPILSHPTPYNIIIYDVYTGWRFSILFSLLLLFIYFFMNNNKRVSRISV